MITITIQDAKDVLLALLAIYGAVLSTFNWRQAAKKDRRSVRVVMETSMPTYGSKLGPCYANLKAINIGHRAISITNVAFELPGGKRMFFTPDNIPGYPSGIFPASLTDGQSVSVLIAYSSVGKALIENGYTSRCKITPIFLDVEGQTYRGKKWKVNPHEVLKM